MRFFWSSFGFVLLTQLHGAPMWIYRWRPGVTVSKAWACLLGIRVQWPWWPYRIVTIIVRSFMKRRKVEWTQHHALLTVQSLPVSGITSCLHTYCSPVLNTWFKPASPQLTGMEKNLTLRARELFQTPLRALPLVLEDLGFYSQNPMTTHSYNSHSRELTPSSGHQTCM